MAQIGWVAKPAMSNNLPIAKGDERVRDDHGCWRIRLRPTEVGQLEEMAERAGAQMRVTQFVKGAGHIDLNISVLGDMGISSLGASELLGVEWQERPGTVNLSICCGPTRVLIEGRDRKIPSVVVYSEPNHGAWAGQLIPRSKTDPNGFCYHVSMPLELGCEFGIPKQFLERSWFELPLEWETAKKFASWADTQATLEDWDPEQVRRQLLDQIRILLQPIVIRPIHPLATSNHARIIRAVGDRVGSIQGPISVSQIAEDINISTRTLQRAFQTTFGIGAKRYVRILQLRQARELLLSGGYSVSAAAHSVGFPHTSRFSREYFQHFGMYPSQTLAGVSSR